MLTKEVRPFGTWPSPISAADAAGAARRIGTVTASGPWVYWSESRPEQRGRQTILRGRPGQPVEDILPEPFSARSRVHEYGGGEFMVAGGIVYFVNDSDQDIYRLSPGGAPDRVTRAPALRFADMAIDPARNRVIAVAERHDLQAEGHHPANLLVAVSLLDGICLDIAAGADFYASPRVSPDGTQLAYLAWNLPDMPWDRAALHLAGIAADGTLQDSRRIAGGSDSAVFQPEWNAEGSLYFVDDRSGWGQLYVLDPTGAKLVHAPRRAELARPLWNFHTRSYALHPDGRIAMVFQDRGRPMLRVQLRSGDGIERDLGAPRLEDPVAFEDGFALVAAAHEAAPSVIKATSGRLPAIIAPPNRPPLDIRAVAKGEIVELAGADGSPVYGVFYAPTNTKVEGPGDAQAPAIVLAHGGPTSMAGRGLSMRTQFYTSRGFAVLDVDYSGSTGYGRAYRERLDGRWGIADVADCVSAAQWLATSGRADPRKIAIAGGSAGGYTVLMALATSKVFAAGASHYGISDLGLLMEHTHKFEAGYLHRLLGTTPDDWRDRCHERSPLAHVDAITCPLILFQGLEDKVVPPEQSRLIASRLEANGVRVALHEFSGEGHGFRRAETIIAVLERERAFLMDVLGLQLTSETS